MRFRSSKIYEMFMHCFVPHKETTEMMERNQTARLFDEYDV